MTSNAAIIDFSFLGDVIKFSIEKLGVAGLVLSICFVLVAVLVVTFRWNAINPNQRFVLIAGLVLLVFGLAGWVVYHSTSSPVRGSGIKYDFLALNKNTPIEFFHNFTPIAVSEYPIDQSAIFFDDGVFKYPKLMLSENANLRLKRYSYSEDEFLLTLLFLIDKQEQSSQLIGYLVLFKNGSLPQEYLSRLKASSGYSSGFLDTAKSFYKNISAVTRTDSHGVEVTEIPRLILAGNNFPLTVIESNTGDWYVVYWLDRRMKAKDGCPMGENPAPFTYSSIKNCDLADGRAVGVGRLLDLRMLEWFGIITLGLGTPSIETWFNVPNSQ